MQLENNENMVFIPNTFNNNVLNTRQLFCNAISLFIPYYEVRFTHTLINPFQIYYIKYTVHCIEKSFAQQKKLAESKVKQYDV